MGKLNPYLTMHMLNTGNPLLKEETIPHGERCNGEASWDSMEGKVICSFTIGLLSPLITMGLEKSGLTPMTDILSSLEKRWNINFRKGKGVQSSTMPISLFRTKLLRRQCQCFYSFKREHRVVNVISCKTICIDFCLNSTRMTPSAKQKWLHRL